MADKYSGSGVAYCEGNPVLDEIKFNGWTGHEGSLIIFIFDPQREQHIPTLGPLAVDLINVKRMSWEEDLVLW